MQNLVRRARRRLLENELLAQGSNSVSAALVAFIFLLLLGSEILNWQIVAAVPLLAFAAGAFLVRRRLPSPYRTAQIVDHRLDLSDTLSTALFFSEVNPGASVEPGVRDAQFEQAGRLAETIDPQKAIPYVMPRGAYIAGVLLLVASSLFALRYGISRQLDLRRPMANFLPESLNNSKMRQASNQKRNPKQTPESPDENGTQADQDQQSPGAEDPQQQGQTAADQDAQASAKQDGKSASGKKQDGSDDQMATDDQDGNESGADKNGDEGQQGAQQGDNKKQGNQQGNSKDQNASSDSSLMNKVKDAIQNLMSRVKPQQQQGNQQGSQEQQQNPGKSQQGSKQQNSKEGTPQQGQQGDAQEGEDGQEAKNAENSQQSKGQGKSDSKQSSKQPGSGIGSQDGDKQIKNAEQLAAMGKISEILGKRSANLTGEATVEVQSTSQQLKTPYANKGAQHTQAGTEIRRDEVPVALQPMVQQYFETIRKQAPATPAKKD
ncbi:MAG TPA: hypothetical protein VKE70_25865 [Candidatus Solibacter sp.]|nr:hypothetical protein [Candidatus Solibacter sp.]